MEWSTEQQAFLDWGQGGKGHLVGRARAGTGKTTTAVEMVKRMRENKILMAAFSKPIALELESRIKSPRIHAKTLHALGFKCIATNWKVNVDSAGVRAQQLAEWADPMAPYPMLKLIKQLHTKARDINPFIALGEDKSALYALAVKFDLLPEDIWESRGWNINRVVDAAHKAMKIATEKTDIIDFADMIFLPLVHNWVTPQYTTVVVDEAQDMTTAQLKLATGSCVSGGRIAVIGDDRQAIYDFRGADSGSLDRLKGELSAKELGLTVTRRCGKKIVELAQQLVPDFRAHESNPDGEILELNADKMIPRAKPGDFILSRMNAPLVRTCMALLKRGTRAVIKGRDIGAGITAIIDRLNPDDVDDLFKKLGHWVQAESVKARKRLPEEAADQRISMITDQADVIRALGDGAHTIKDLITRAADLFKDDGKQSSVVTCSSVHRAKGLEAETVYILVDTLREGNIEEDNIRYVAITRAKHTLVWVTGEPNL